MPTLADGDGTGVEPAVAPDPARGGLGRFGRQLGGVYLASAINGILGTALVPVAAAALGREGYGVFSLHGVIAGYVVLLELGLGKNLVRELAASAGDRAAERDRFRLALGLYAAISVVLVATLPVLVWLATEVAFPLDPPFRAMVGWVTALAVAEYVVGVPAALMQIRCVAAERFDAYARYNAASGVVRYGLAFAAVLLLREPHLAVAVIVTRKVADVALARWLMGGLPAGSWRPSLDVRGYARLLGASAALSLSQAFQLTMISLGASLAVRGFGAAGLGAFRAAFDLASRVWFFSNAIGLLLFPRFVRMLAGEATRERLIGALPTVLAASAIAYLGLGVLGALVAPWVLPLVGLAQPSVVALFAVVLVGVCLNAHANLPVEFIQAGGRYLVVAVCAAASGVVLWGAFRLLAPALGLQAVAWAWLVSQGVFVLALEATMLQGRAARAGSRAGILLRVGVPAAIASALALVSPTLGPGVRLAAIATCAAALGAAALRSRAGFRRLLAR